MIEDPEIRKKLPMIFLDEKTVEKFIDETLKVKKEQLGMTEPVFETFRVNAKKENDHSKMLAAYSLKETKERLQDVSTIIELIDVLFRQNIMQSKQISKLLRLIDVKDVAKKEEIEELKLEITDTQKKVTAVEEHKAFKFLKRQYDDEANDTTHD